MTEVLQHAIYVADLLISKAKIDGQGLFWNTCKENKSVRPGIFDGVTGVVLFFIELYPVTKNVEYIEIIEAGICWAEHKSSETLDNFSLFTGRGGVVYALLRLYEVTRDERYLDRAELISREINFSSLNERATECNLHDGLAGSILALIHLHRYTNAEWIGRVVTRLVKSILQNAKINKCGDVFWINTKRFDLTTALCGFGDGNSGIGYVFCELAEYTGNKQLFWFAEQCFQYEENVFDTKQNNWPDFRRQPLTTTDYIREWNRYQFGLGNKWSSELKFSSGWRCGRAGIILSRIRKCELQKTLLDDRLQKVISKIKLSIIDHSVDGQSASISEGIVGSGMVMLEAYKNNGDSELLSAAKNLSDKLWKRIERQRVTTDLSLMKGLAGVGYYFIRMHQAETNIGNYTAGIVRPDIAIAQNTERSMEGFEPLMITEIIETVLRSNYPRTLDVVKNAYDWNVANDGVIPSSGNAFRGQLERFVALHREDDRLAECYEYEDTFNAADIFSASRVESCIKRFGDLWRMRELMNENSGEEIIRKLPFRITPGATLRESKCNWSGSVVDISQDHDDECYTLFLPTELKVLEYALSKAQAYLLRVFESKKRPIEAFYEFCDDQGLPRDDQSLGLLREMFFELVRTGALMPCDKTLLSP